MNKYNKHDKLRKRVNLSFYKDDLELLKSRHGFIPDATQVKQILLTGEVKIITKNSNPDSIKILTQLSRIGNNINQVAFLSNAQKEVALTDLLISELEKLNELYQIISKSI